MNNTSFLHNYGRVLDHAFEDLLPDTFGKAVHSNFDREENSGYCRGASLGGRVACALLIPVHLLGIVGKTYFQAVAAVGFGILVVPLSVYAVAKAIFTLSAPDFGAAGSCLYQAGALGVSAILAPVGQTIRVARAALGIFHPGAYFKAAPNAGLHPVDAGDANPGAHPVNQGNAQQPAANYVLLGNIHQGTHHYTCDRAHLNSRPCEELNGFAAWNATPVGLKITFQNENGYDEGGLRREYISTLFGKVSAQLEMFDGVIYAGNNEANLTSIGKVLKHLLFKLDDMNSVTETPIGEVFDERYYQGILAFSHEDLEGDWEGLGPYAKLDAIDVLIDESQKDDHERNVSIYGKIFANEDNPGEVFTAEDFNTILNAANEADDKRFENYTMATLTKAQMEEMQDWFIDDYIAGYDGQVKTLFLLATEVHQGISQAHWQNLQQLGHKRIQLHIQGEFNRQVVLDSIVVAGVPVSMGIEIKAILAGKGDLELKQFLKTTTGSTVLRPLGKVRFFAQAKIEKMVDGQLQNAGLEYAYFPHTCTQCVDIKAGLTGDGLKAAIASMCVNPDGFDVK